jgi:hypothetical protein
MASSDVSQPAVRDLFVLHPSNAVPPPPPPFPNLGFKFFTARKIIGFVTNFDVN